jgi:hypothetical protein
MKTDWVERAFARYKIGMMAHMADEEKTISIKTLIPEVGDRVMIINRGDHYEIVRRLQQLHLTDEDIQKLNAGDIVWQ